MPPNSSVARLQQVMTVFALLMVLGWFHHWWPRNALMAVAGALSIGLGYAWFIALELLLLPGVARGDAAPRARPGELLRAWAAETVMALRVFAWRQPFRWRSVPDLLEGEDLHGRTGVVFVHGFVCNRGFWTPWLARLRRQRRAFIAVNLEPIYCPIDEHVPVIDAAVRRVREVTGRPPVLVGHSMGGLAARAWLRHQGDEALAHLITLGTPHRGTWLARFSRLPCGLQMQPGSAWLQALEADLRSTQAARTSCWYSNSDNVVMPASTATLPGAENHLVRGAGHTDLAFKPAVMAACMARIAACDEAAPQAVHLH